MVYIDMCVGALYRNIQITHVDKDTFIYMHIQMFVSFQSCTFFPLVNVFK